MKKLFLALSLFVFCSWNATAQWDASCNWNPAIGSTSQYAYTNSIAYKKAITWTVPNGTVTSQWLSADSKTAYCTINWTAPSYSGQVVINQGSTFVASHYVDVACPTTYAPTFSVTNSAGGGSSWSGPVTFTINASVGSGGSNVYWYTAASGGAPFHQGLSYTTPTLSSNTTYYISTYYLTYTDPEAGTQTCQSSRTPVSLTFVPPPPPTFNIENHVCQSGIAQVIATPGAGGNNVWWYNASNEVVYQGSMFTTPVISTTTTYNIATVQTVTGLMSTKVPVTINVYSLPAIPTAAPQARCGSGQITLTATPGSGESIRWYDTQDNLITTGSSYSPTLSSTTTYRVRAYNSSTGCQSNFKAVIATINAIPDIPSIAPSTTCAGKTAHITGTPGSSANTIHWYDVASGGSYVESSTYTTVPLNSNSTFYGSSFSTTTGCEGVRVSTQVTVNSNPVEPVPYIVNGVCSLSGSGTIGANVGNGGNQVKWYESVDSPHSVYTGADFGTPVINTPTTWYLTSSNTTTGCESNPRTQVTLSPTIVQPPVSVTPAVRCDEGTLTLSATPSSSANGIRWYASPTEETLVSDQTNFTTPVISNTTTYYAASYNSVSGCASASRIAVEATIRPKPKPLFVQSPPVYGSGAVTLSVGYAYSQGRREVTSVTLSDTTELQVLWFSSEANALANTPILTKGLVYTTPPITQTTNYYARLLDKVVGCIGDPGKVTATVIPYIIPQSVQSDVIRVAGKKDETALASLTNIEQSSAVTYLDGMGRTHQQVIRQGSPLGKDVVQPVDFDNWGRASKTYLPYVASTTNGSFHSSYQAEQASFYQTSGDKITDDTKPYAVTVYEDSPAGRIVEQGKPGVAFQPGTTHTTRLVYAYNTGATSNALEEVRNFNTDGSSSGFVTANKLNRIQSTDADGKKLVIFQDGSGHTIVQKQQLDQTIDGVMVNWLETYYIYDDFGRVRYMISPKGVAALKSNGWAFSAVKDNYVHQFVYDARGRIIEKKTPGQAWSYMVYDNLGRVALTQDGLQRASNKWSFIKYDQKGRPVMQGIYLNATQTTRTAIQTMVEGVYTSSNVTYPENAFYESRATVLHGYSNTSFPKTNADNSALEVWSVNYYDNYDFDFNGTDDVGYSPQLLPNENTPTNFTTGLSTGSKKLVLNTSTWLYSYVFYDDRNRPIQIRSNNHLNPYLDDLSTMVYDFEGKVITTQVQQSDVDCAQTGFVQRQSYDAGGRLKNIYRPVVEAENMTWSNASEITVNGSSAIKDLSTNNWEDGDIASMNYLDDNQNGWIEFKTGESNNYKLLGLSDQEANANYATVDYSIYLTDGQVAILENGVHVTTVGTFTPTDLFSVERKNGAIYYRKNNVLIWSSLQPHLGRLYVQGAIYSSQGTFKDIRLYKESEKIIAQYEYNELGQLVDKKLHNTTGNDFLQSLDYRYTLHGQLQSINNAQLTADSGVTNDDSNDYFGMEYIYNDVVSGLGNTALYNGNISAIKWKGAGGPIGVGDQKSYKYTYDNSNKLLMATSQVFNGTWNKEAGALNESMTYDHNGNIKTLQRNQRQHQLAGLAASYTATNMDQLTYAYNSVVGDQLLKVTDAATTAGFNNGTSATSTDYTYDVNGNVLSDLNKGISGIIYNLLGKPLQINFSDGKKIEYVYDATGNKLTMKTFQGSTLQKTIDYVNGFQYENGKLATYAAPEGRVIMKGSYPEYQYAIADQQGNTRVVFSSAPAVAQAKTAGMEEVSNGEFQNYPTGGSRNSLSIYNHTPGGTYSQLLNGGNNSQIGVAKSYKVYPGDKVKINAYAKYANLTSNTSNVSAFASALLNAFLLPAPLTGEAGTASRALNDWGGIVAAGGDGQSNTAPRVSVNIIVFDKNYNFLDAAFDQIDPAAEQVGVTPVVAHDLLSKEYTVNEEGYVFMYIANENATQVDAYFDDVAMTYTPTNIVQYNEYYPFGLQASTSWTRESNTNNFLYNEGSELNAEAGWYETMFRGYDASLGRFMQVDPLAHLTHAMSSYQYADGSPILLNDPLGLKAPAGTSVSSWERIQRLQEYSSYGGNVFAQWDIDDAGGTQIFSPWGGNHLGGNIYEGEWMNLYSFEGQTLYDNKYGKDSRVIISQTQAGFGIGEGLGSFELALFALKPTFDRAAQLAKSSGGIGKVPLNLARNLFKALKDPLLINNKSLFLGRIGAASAISISNHLNKIAPTIAVLGVVTNAYDILKDGKITAGDVFQAGNTALMIAFPVYGVIYGVADLGFAVFSDQSLTDRIKSGIDSRIEGSINLPPLVK